MRPDPDTNQWSLFGYDMRSIGQLWTQAWRDFLFSEASPLRRSFDEPVRLVSASGSQVYHAGKAVADDEAGAVQCEALSIPEELFLARTITLPLAVEGELDAVLAMELSSNSPFDAADTISGWKEVKRSDEQITILLVVAARSALLHWLAAHHPERDVSDIELWAGHGDAQVPLQGFGEERRARLYRQRLVRAAGLAAGFLVLVYAVLGLFVLQQRVVLQKYDTLQAQVMQTSAGVAERRERLLAANRAIEAANDLVSGHPNPHVELARLTQLLGDDAYLAHFSMRGRDLRLRGRAADAASVMQTLSREPDFASVTAPQAITAVGTTGLEQFYLDVELADPDSAAGDES